MTSYRNVLILFSGGLDSTALIPYYNELNFNIRLLWVDYNQRSNQMENIAVSGISEHYGLEVVKIKTNIKEHNKNDYEFIGRNLFLISLAAMVFPFKHGLISIGIRLNPAYRDCTIPFLELANSLIELVSDGEIVVEAPLYDYSKKDVLEYCIAKNVPIYLTYSCENGESKPCETCPSCLELKQAYEEIGLKWRI